MRFDLLFHFFDVFMCHPSLRAIGSSLDQTARRVRHRCKKRNTSSQQSHQQLVELRLGTLLRPHNHPHAVVCTETAALFRLPTARRARKRRRKRSPNASRPRRLFHESVPSPTLVLQRSALPSVQDSLRRSHNPRTGDYTTPTAR